MPRNRHVNVRCQDCGELFETGANVAHSAIRCPACRIFHQNNRYRESRRKNRPADYGKSAQRVWHVVFDPLDSFRPSSTYTRGEVDDMIRLGYLAEGTIFETTKGSQHKVIWSEEKGFVLGRI